MDPSVFENVVKVDRTVVDPDAVVAQGHCIILDALTS
jgi:hypothetical protein